jgi:hypothetical protein
MKRTTYDEFRSSTTDDAMGLKENEGKTTCMVKKIRSRKWVHNT